LVSLSFSYIYTSLARHIIYLLVRFFK
jgi:hypothetical protein